MSGHEYDPSCPACNPDNFAYYDDSMRFLTGYEDRTHNQPHQCQMHQCINCGFDVYDRPPSNTDLYIDDTFEELQRHQNAYYYEPVPDPHQEISNSQNLIYDDSNPMQYFYPDRSEQPDCLRAPNFRSSPQIPMHHPIYLERMQSAALENMPREVVQKFLGTTQVPRRVRKQSSSLNRRSTPPCSFYGQSGNLDHRNRLSSSASNSTTNTIEKPQERQHSYSEGDISGLKSFDNLDNYLNSLEKQIAENRSSRKRAKEAETAESKTSISEISHLFKPKVPLSVQQKRAASEIKNEPKDEEKNRLLPNVKRADRNASTLRENEPKSLDKLLNKLKKCEYASGSSSDEEVKEDVIREGNGDETNRCHNDMKQAQNEVFSDAITEIDLTQQSFNYSDISNHMLRSKVESAYLEDDLEIERYQRDMQLYVNDSRLHQLKLASSATTVFAPNLEEISALEVHRSKTYILNLIDRALSKEMGTTPGENFTYNEFENMHPKKAIDLMNRPPPTTVTQQNRDRNFCLEITTALTDSLISNATAPPADAQRSLQELRRGDPDLQEKYKPLRWGHIRNIEREIQRLRELENFLENQS